MKIPKKINILGFTYDVLFTDDMNILGDCYGRCKFIEQKIYVKKDQAPEQQFQTFWHEVLHAIDWITSGEGSCDLTEKQNDIMATGVASVLMNNKL